MENRAETNRNYDICPLDTLINILKNFFDGRARIILEVTLLEEFPTDVILPVERFSPRQIIENMMEKHGRTVQDIWENPKNLQTVVFTYTAETKGEQIQFTNNMEFYADIQTICFFYHRILKFYESIRDKSIRDIMEMIIHKYGINTESQTENLDPTAITFRRPRLRSA